MTNPGSYNAEYGRQGHEDEGSKADHLAHHFDTPKQQFQAGKLGMWLFMLTEILLFGGLFCAYAVYRANHPEIFFYAERFLDKTLGALNTCVLITSSLTMAWAVRCAQRNHKRGLIVCLALTLALAFGFLGVKCVEYKHKWEDGLRWASLYDPNPQAVLDAQSHRQSAGLSTGPEPQERKNAGIFFSIYFLMTGLHGIHVIGGMIVISWLLIRASKGTFSSRYFGPVDYVGLYWHLVDMIWIYLFPLLYLIH
jgi:cytochrome c oxidase subunit 3